MPSQQQLEERSAARRKRAADARKETEAVDSPPSKKKAAERNREALEPIDALLDEIDEVLESNAEAFVKDYIQRGGE